MLNKKLIFDILSVFPFDTGNRFAVHLLDTLFRTHLTNKVENLLIQRSRNFVFFDFYAVQLCLCK